LINRIPFGEKHIPLHVFPKGQYKIEDNGAAKRNKRSIDKIQAYFRGGNIEPFADAGAYAKHIQFNKIAKPVHVISFI
jgi:hypothetical protein